MAEKMELSSICKQLRYIKPCIEKWKSIINPLILKIRDENMIITASFFDRVRIRDTHLTQERDA